jgi:hypothetical protein
MTTGPADTGVRSVRLPTSSRTERPGVAERDARQVVLCCRLLGDIGALLLGLMVAQGIQQALAAVRPSVAPLGSTGVFNTLAILLWLSLFANAGLYDSRRLVNATDEFKRILQTVATGTVAATFTAFALKVPTQRSWVLATWVGCTLAVLAIRFAYRWLLSLNGVGGRVLAAAVWVWRGRTLRNRRLEGSGVTFDEFMRPAGDILP